MEDMCISCGEIIPEGRQVCPACQKATVKEFLIDLMREAESEYINNDQQTLFEAIAEKMVANGVTATKRGTSHA